MKDRMPRVGIVLFPWKSPAPYSFVGEMIEILDTLSESIIVITGDASQIQGRGNARAVDVGVRPHYIKDSRTPRLSIISWMLKSFLFQFSSSLALLKERRNLEVVFFLAHPYETIPLIVARIAGIKTIEVVTRGKSEQATIISKMAELSESVSFSCCTSIAVETFSLMEGFAKSRYKKKVVGEAARFVDLELFKSAASFSSRRRTVVYIGRFRKEKGIAEFVQAVPFIIERADADVILLGSGDLEPDIQSCLSRLTPQTRGRIHAPGWAEKEEVARVLGNATILVMPSQSEGLPTVALQAMASGVVVLASRVGGLNDLIQDGVNGFYLNGLDSKTLEEDVIRIISMESHCLSKVTEMGLQTIQDKYTLKQARERYRVLLSHTLDG